MFEFSGVSSSLLGKNLHFFSIQMNHSWWHSLVHSSPLSVNVLPRETGGTMSESCDRLSHQEMSILSLTIFSLEGDMCCYLTTCCMMSNDHLANNIFHLALHWMAILKEWLNPWCHLTDFYLSNVCLTVTFTKDLVLGIAEIETDVILKLM